MMVMFSFPIWAWDSGDLPSTCPEGGIKKGRICCKDGYYATYRHTEKGLIFEGYNSVSGLCGCPDGGKKGVKNESACCKDGYRYVDYKKDYVAIDIEACGHPEEGYEPKESHGRSWCQNGFLYINKGDPWLKPDECGCPEGHEYKPKGEYVEGFCCKDGYELYDKDSYRINYEICGCPKGTQHAKYNICCLKNKQGYAIENPSMGGRATEKLDFMFCGCPENGEMKNVGLPLYICCKDGYKLDEKTGLYSIRETICDSKSGPMNNFIKKMIGL